MKPFTVRMKPFTVRMKPFTVRAISSYLPCKDGNA